MKEIFREISIEEIEGFRIGNAQDAEGGSGCTVIICEKGAVGGVDVRGGGPASRETDLLDPQKACQEVYGVLLSGGSAFGLDAAGGVMRYLEEREIGRCRYRACAYRPCCLSL
ncbi:MAG: P1 family peptidase [Clostridia bacterium]